MAVAKDRGHRLLRHAVASPQLVDRLGSQGRQARSVPTARRVARGLVVRGQRRPRFQAGITGGDLPRQVGVPVVGDQLVYRHHRYHPRRVETSYA